MDPWIWLLFGVAIAALLLVDLVVAGRTRGIPSFRSAALWSVGWIAVALAFAGVLAVWQGAGAAEEYVAGYLIERSLSLDNLFVFALIFTYFGVPAAAQRRVLFFGIAGAIVLRAAFILAGAALLDAFHWTMYAFGALLLVTGVRMATHDTSEIHPERNPVLRLVRRVVPMTAEYHGDRVVVREGGRRVATPVLAALLLVATFDVVFAIDSIPAIFAITRDTFIVFAANAFSLLGLASLYFLLAGMVERFRHLNVGLALILVFVGLKMLLADVVHVPTLASLAFIAVALGGAVLASHGSLIDWVRGFPVQRHSKEVRMPTKMVMLAGIAVGLIGLGTAVALADEGAAKPQVRDVDADLVAGGKLRLEAETAMAADRVRFTYAGRRYAARVVDTDREDRTRDWARTIKADRAARPGKTITIVVRACDGGECTTRSSRERLDRDDDRDDRSDHADRFDRDD